MNKPKTLALTLLAFLTILSLGASLNLVRGAPETHFVISAPASASAGAAFSVTVTAKDAAGNTVANYSGTVSFTSSDIKAVLPANSTVSNGVGSFSVTLKTVGLQSITATDTNTSITGNIGVALSPGPLDHFTIAYCPPTVNSGQSFGPQNDILVTAYDAFGNVKTDYTGSVYFTSTDPRATLPYTSINKYTFTTGIDADNGVQWFEGETFTLYTVSPQTITVTDGTTSATSNPINVGPEIPPLTFTIATSAGPNGAIDPSGQITANMGDSPTFRLLPNPGYHVSDIIVDGTSVGAANTYTFKNIQANHNITATFAINTYTITSSAGANGAISPSGIISVNYGANQTYTITVNSEFGIADVSVDGVSVGNGAVYTFTNVAANHSITATFTHNKYAITVNSSHGTPTASSAVNPGDNFTASVTSPDGDSSHRWISTGYTLDGITQNSGTSYTFTNIQVNHTITFNWQEQYYLTVTSPTGTATGSGWYNASTTAYATVPASISLGSTGTQYIFTKWSGDVAGAALTSNAIIMNGPKTATATWKTQYYLTVTSPYGNPTGQGWYDANSLANIGATDIISVNGGTQYLFSSWTGTGLGAYTGSLATPAVIMNAPITETANYKTQYYLTVASLYGNPTGQGWYDAGSTTNFAITQTITTGTETRYTFASWTGNGISAYNGTAANPTITINGPAAETATWNTQYQVTYAANGNTLTVAAPATEWVTSGSAATGIFPASIINAASDTRCTLLSDNRPTTITQPTLITATYKTQFLVKYAAKGNALQVTIPDSQWVNSGAPATATFQTQTTNAGSDTRCNLVSDNRPTAITIPTTITATYQTQYKVTCTQTGMNSDATGAVLTAYGNAQDYTQLPKTTWINSDTSVAFTFNSKVATTTDTKQYILQSTNATSPIVINGPTTIEAKYQTENGTSLTVVAGAALAIVLIIVFLLLSIILYKRRKQ